MSIIVILISTNSSYRLLKNFYTIIIGLLIKNEVGACEDFNGIVLAHGQDIYIN
jgi:hypothetical protein